MALLFSFSNPVMADPIIGFSFFHEIGLARVAGGAASGDPRSLYAHTLAFEVGFKPSRNFLIGGVGQMESFVQMDGIAIDPVTKNPANRLPNIRGKMTSLGPSVSWRNDGFFLQLQYILFGSVTFSAPPLTLPGRTVDVKDYALTGVQSWKARAGMRLFGVLYVHGFLGFSEFAREKWNGNEKATGQQKFEDIQLTSPLRWMTMGVGTTVVF